MLHVYRRVKMNKRRRKRKDYIAICDSLPISCPCIGDMHSRQQERADHSGVDTHTLRIWCLSLIVPIVVSALSKLLVY